MPIEAETKTVGGKEVRFAATPPMSSYLNVFCAGELDTIHAKKGDVTHGVMPTEVDVHSPGFEERHQGAAAMRWPRRNAAPRPVTGRT